MDIFNQHLLLDLFAASLDGVQQLTCCMLAAQPMLLAYRLSSPHLAAACQALAVLQVVKDVVSPLLWHPLWQSVRCYVCVLYLYLVSSCAKERLQLITVGSKQSVYLVFFLHSAQFRFSRKTLAPGGPRQPIAIVTSQHREVQNGSALRQGACRFHTNKS